MAHSHKRCTAIRRLNNELKKIDKKYIVEPFNTSEDNSFIRLNVRYNDIKYNIKVPEVYPFKGFSSVYINNNDYINFMSSVHKIKLEIYRKNNMYTVEEFMKEKIGFPCLCCESIMCHGDWHPQKTVEMLLDETLRNINLVKKLWEIKMLGKIIKKYSLGSIPILDFIN